MLTHPTIEKLHALHLTAMAQAFEQQRGSSQHAELSFEDRFGLLVETEWTAREQRRLTQRLRQAKPRYPGAALEDVDFATSRGLPREVVLSLGTGAWIRDHHNLLMSGPTGIGKSWLASAFVESACRHGFTATYVRAPRLRSPRSYPIPVRPSPRPPGRPGRSGNRRCGRSRWRGQ